MMIDERSSSSFSQSIEYSLPPLPSPVGSGHDILRSDRIVSSHDRVGSQYYRVGSDWVELGHKKLTDFELCITRISEQDSQETYDLKNSHSCFVFSYNKKDEEQKTTSVTDKNDGKEEKAQY